MSIEKKYIDMVLDKVELVDVVSDYVDLKAKGHRAWGCCPFHNEDTASFCVDLNKNLWHCFGCQKGGNVINFVMEIEGLPFPLAVKKLLKDKLNIELKDEELMSTPEEEEKYKKIESMRIINDKLCSFFESELRRDTPDAKAALSYMQQRWNEEFCKESRIGYAPRDSRQVLQYAEKSGLNIELMKEMGLLFVSEKANSLYCPYWNRVMIPIRDRYSNIIGFTARTLDEDTDKRKYINSCDSAVYHKSESVFGIHNAMIKARRNEKLYLVEGGPDVLKLQSVGILNTIASLGGAWTKEQFLLLKSYRLQNCTLTFIPDSDIPKAGERLGAGFKNVLENGRLAMSCGFTVNVAEIPIPIGVGSPQKMDPDSFFVSANDMSKLTEKEFILWYFEKNLDKDGTTETKQKVIEEVADLLLSLKSEDILEAYVTKLAKMDGTKALWRQAISSAKVRQQQRRSEKHKNGGIDMLRVYGFAERNKCYYGLDKYGDEIPWSNFVLRPLFHIKDDLRPVRLFEIDNCEPEDKAEVIEIDMDTFTSSKSMRKYLLGRGNYIWMAGDEQLIRLQRFLAKTTETATEIKQLGWQKEGFYAFSNGVLEDGEWHPIDDMGIVRIDAGIFYLPALSAIYRNSKELYVNERRFRLTSYSNVSLEEYFRQIVRVFGDNAKVALAFYTCSLFADVIRGRGIKIPILNLFGQPGTGKTELANTMMSFFVVEHEAPNIESTIASLTDYVASMSNALVHIDEYKNSIDEKKSQFLKDIWGGVGRMRMNMDKDKKREQARVDSVLMLTGQEMPTVDFALFTRLIFLSCEKNTFSDDDQRRYEELMKLRMMGASHITIELLKHRDKFEASLGSAWKKAETDMKYGLRGDQLAVDRLRTNWSVILAAYMAMSDSILWPFSYEELLSICINLCKRQNSLCTTVDEVAGFWQIVSAAIQMGKLVNEQDFMVKNVSMLKVAGVTEPVEFFGTKAVLMIRKEIFFTRYLEMAKQQDEKKLPKETIEKYLENTQEYLGMGSTPERFKKFTATGFPEMDIKYDDKGNVTSRKTKWQQSRPMCFDYEMVAAKYNIMLDESDTKQDEALPF